MPRSSTCRTGGLRDFWWTCCGGSGAQHQWHHIRPGLMPWAAPTCSRAGAGRADRRVTQSRAGCAVRLLPTHLQTTSASSCSKGKAFPFRDLPDLRGKRIGGVTGASYGERVDAAIRDGEPRHRPRHQRRQSPAQAGSQAPGRRAHWQWRAWLEWLLAHDPRLAEYRDRFGSCQHR